MDYGLQSGIAIWILGLLTSRKKYSGKRLLITLTKNAAWRTSRTDESLNEGRTTGYFGVGKIDSTDVKIFSMVDESFAKK